MERKQGLDPVVKHIFIEMGLFAVAFLLVIILLCNSCSSEAPVETTAPILQTQPVETTTEPAPTEPPTPREALQAVMAENGLNMMDFAYVPDVVARHRFSTDDFFLYYPLTEGAWRKTPCQLDSTVHAFSKAVYIPCCDRWTEWTDHSRDRR